MFEDFKDSPVLTGPRDFVSLSSVQEKPSSITEDSEITPDSSVNEARRIIAQKQQVDINSVHIIFDGKVLRNEKRLKDYGISNNSLLHIVCSSSTSTSYSQTNTPPVFGVSKTNADICFEPIICNPEEEASDCDDYGEPIVDSVIFHIFGDVLNNFADEEENPLSVDVITSAIDSDISIIKAALQTPLVKDIMSDISFLRKLLLSNDLIIDMINTNPGFLELINNDDCLNDLVNVLVDTNGYQDYPHLRTMLLQKIERALGNRLKVKGMDGFVVPIFCTKEEHFLKRQQEQQELSQQPQQPFQPQPQPHPQPSQPQPQQPQPHPQPSLPHPQQPFQPQPHPHPQQPQQPQPHPQQPFQPHPHHIDKRYSDKHCREDHIALLCQIAANRPDIVKAFMKRTPMYKCIATKRPDLVNELLKPERLKLIASPEMVRAIVKLDDCIQKQRRT